MVMATDTDNVQVGVGVISVGDWVTAGGAGSLSDVGHLFEAPTLTPSFEDYPVKSERTFGTIKRVPTDGSIKLKVPIMEVTAEHYRIAFRQPSGNKSGTTPDFTLLFGDFQEQYHQLQVVTVGTGTGNSRTFTFWRGYVESVDEIAFAKGQEQRLGVVFDCLYDDSVTTNDKFGKMVDA